MTTATTVSWPTGAELDVAEALLSKASNAIDELQLRYFRLDREMVDGGSD